MEGTAMMQRQFLFYNSKVNIKSLLFDFDKKIKEK